MTYLHESADFEDLLLIVAQERQLSSGLVEKDYWVTHTLWALHEGGFEVWFKGGTSLSKGFGIINRFSEDLDLKIEAGRAGTLPTVSSWTSDSARARGQRQAHYQELSRILTVPGAQVTLDWERIDETWRSADLRVTYPGYHANDMGPLTPFVRLEVGRARVTPFVTCNITSWAHEMLAAQAQLKSFRDTRPKGVRCVHPLVTLLEKIDAVQRRFPRPELEPPAFIRHYEDLARIIQADYPPPDAYTAQSLATEMQVHKQIRGLPEGRSDAFMPDRGPRWVAVRAAYAAIAPMYWGRRLSLDEACATIREWISDSF